MLFITQEGAALRNLTPVFPSTRFQGSKLKIVEWIWDSIKDLNFETVLDAFGGTGSVGYLLKKMNKQVTYNDALKFNWYIGMALIENSSVKLSEEEVEFLVVKHKHIEYPTVIYDSFPDIFFTNEENQWIDMMVTNINLLTDVYKKAIAYFALFQSCIIKRPFNLFHRKNLYLRLSEVERNFGNKTTWDTSFEIHFRRFVKEANNAIFDNERNDKAFNLDIFDVEGRFDLIYIDTPYISKKGTGVDYFGFYHFLEGLVHYEKWREMIDYRTKHKKLISSESVWNDKRQIYMGFDKLFNKFKDSILVVSYRSDGIPSIAELKVLLKIYKPSVKELQRKKYKYVLSNNQSEEVLLIGE